MEWPPSGLESVLCCPICGEDGRSLIHDDLVDRLYGAPGKWSMWRCSSCDSAYLDPRPNEKTINLAYENYGTHHKDGVAEDLSLSIVKRLKRKIRNDYLNKVYGYQFVDSVFWGAFFMSAMPKTIRGEWDYYAHHLSRSLGTGSLLDVGCGNGAFMLRAQSAGWTVSGIDPDPVACAMASDKGLVVQEGTYKECSFNEDSFDVVVAEQVIEHVHDPRDFLRKIRTWIKPGGSLWLSTPNINSIVHSWYKGNFVSLYVPTHLVMFSASGLERILMDSGYSDVRFLSRGLYNHYAVKESARLAEERGVMGNPVVHNAQIFVAEFLATISNRLSSDFVCMARK